MKKLKYEARGVTAAVIISTVAPTGDPALDDILEMTESAFVARAEEYALARRDAFLSMTAAERRRALPAKISLSCVKSGGDIAQITLTAALESDGVSREKKTSFFFDAPSSLASKKPKRQKIKTSREKL